MTAVGPFRRSKLAPRLSEKDLLADAVTLENGDVTLDVSDVEMILATRSPQPRVNHYGGKGTKESRLCLRIPRQN